MAASAVFNSATQLALPPEVWNTVKLTTAEREGVSLIRVLPVKSDRKPAPARDGADIRTDPAKSAKTATFFSLVMTASFPPALGEGDGRRRPGRLRLLGGKGVIGTYGDRERLSRRG